MHLSHNHGHLLGATLLVAGTSIGVAILALPVATAMGGFIPSIFLYLAVWLFMLSTGLLILEACIWMPQGANLITLTERLLGKWGKVLCWIIYLYLFYCLIIAHLVSGGSAIVAISLDTISIWLGTIIYTLLFAPIVYLGTLWVDRLNITLMIGVVITYILFVSFGIPLVNIELLKEMNWHKAWVALPVIFTAFGYQNIIPTLVTYLKRDIRKVRISILIGTFIPFLIYLLWQFTILGAIPLQGPHGLLEALAKGETAIAPLQHFSEKAFLSTIGQTFAFFVMTTSFIGISIAFVDFLADGLKISKKGWNKLLICTLIFGIPLIITLIYPSIFLAALGYAGGIGVSILLGILPILMVWNGRYKKKLHAPRLLPFGKPLLAILFVFAFFQIIIELILR